MTDQQLRTLVRDLLTHLGLSLEVEVKQDGDLFLVNLVGGDARYFERGKDNKSGALVTIIKLMVKHQFDEEPKLILDMNGQRQERLHNVVQLARKKAEMVRISGQEEEMPPMTPAERRAVHMELKTMSGIKTESRGVEPHRRIVILINDEDE